MKNIFLLSGENINLAREEVLALSGSAPKEMVDNVLLARADFKYKRLALTRKVYEYLFSCKYEDLEKRMKEYNWKRVYKQSFSLKIVNLIGADLKKKEAQLAKYIWENVNEPRVDLKFAQTKIEIIVTDEKVYVGRVVCVPKSDFSRRRSHLRPGKHPTSLNPKIARACVNVSGIKTGSVVVDPFCGAGGLLIEAGLMRFNTRGYDINDDMLRKCKQNLEYYQIKRFKLENRDARNISEQIDYVITDLPYGRNSQTTDHLDKLYLEFLRNLQGVLRDKAVVIFPNFVDHKKIINKTDFNVEKEFSVYIHKSLSRNIVLLGKR